MMDEIKMCISIIIPNYNSEKWIDKLLNSILTQTYKKYEVIIVDDMSIDNSVDIIKKYCKKYKQFRLIENKSKRLSGGTRNVGITESTGDYIMCIDSDDWLKDDNVLQDIVNKLNGEDIMFLGYEMYGGDNATCILNIHNKDEAIKCGMGANWLKVVKRELYLDHLLPEGTLFEDRFNHLELCIYANTFTSLGRATHIWNRTNENCTTLSNKWCWYRFEYCGELYKLIQRVHDADIRDMLIKELVMYMNSCVEMVNEL